MLGGRAVDNNDLIETMLDETEIEDYHQKIYNLSLADKRDLLIKFKGDIMQHYKGDFILVMDVLPLHNTETYLVFYKNLFGTCDVVARPMEEFFEWVENAPGKVTQNKMRFEPVNITSRVIDNNK